MAILLCSVAIYNCNSQKRFIKNDNLCELDLTLIDKLEKNPKKYDSLIARDRIVTIANDKLYESSIWKLSNGDYSLKQTNKQTNIGKWGRYYSNGKLKSIVFKHEYGYARLNKETHYDINGTITKVIDHRQADKYPICYKEAIAIVKRRMAKRDTIFSLGRDKWVTKTKDTLRTWEVFVREIDKKKEEEKSWVYRVNAVTGEIINKKEVISNPG